VLVTEVWRGRLWSAVPHRVVRSSSREIVTFARAGTRAAFASSRGVSGREQLSRAERKMEALRSGVVSVVQVPLELSTLSFFADQSWARISLGWDADGRFGGWYVNFEMPPRVTPEGIQTMDLILDALVSPAGEWRWKDREDFDRAVGKGLLDPATPDAITAASAAIHQLLESGAGAFCRDWTGWRPPASWRTPELPSSYAVGGKAWTTT
jgi:predicted RNA-binding protein associated with RNAse of E/G family